MTKKEISFENGNHAIVVTVPCDTDPQSILKALALAPPNALVIVLGGERDSTIRGKLVWPNCSAMQSHRRLPSWMRSLSTEVRSRV